jgi:hypothetical protein
MEVKMAKDLVLNLRIESETAQMLEALAKLTVRTKSDMVRFLIRREFTRLNSEPAPAEPGEPQQLNSVHPVV